MTNAFEIRRVSPAYPPKSGCGVPPQAVLDASRFQSSPSRSTIFRLNRIQGVWESRLHSSSSFQRFSFQNFSF